MEPPFDKLDGVQSTTSGYTGGHVADPTYRQVSSGNTGHAEAVQIVYDSTAVSYSKLLEVFWHNIDPTQANGQFCDIGSQYRSAIFYHNARQKKLAEASKRTIEQSGRFEQSVVTDIEPLSAFYTAEDYHQNFYQTHPERYNQYRQACGRDHRLEELWGTDKTSSIF
jgi:peptide-methionine (S)-S-oxide reductase